jgi:hypothetical protein
VDTESILGTIATKKYGWEFLAALTQIKVRDSKTIEYTGIAKYIFVQLF